MPRRADGIVTRLAEFGLEQLREEQVRQLRPTVRGVRPVPLAVGQVTEVDVARAVRRDEDQPPRPPRRGLGAVPIIWGSGSVRWCTGGRTGRSTGEFPG